LFRCGCFPDRRFGNGLASFGWDDPKEEFMKPQMHTDEITLNRVFEQIIGCGAR
jgi:hypothetical protein